MADYRIRWECCYSVLQGTKSTGFDGHKHTTDVADGGINMQSVIENNDLTELLTMVRIFAPVCV